MAKASITKKMALNGHGILEINDDGIFLENLDTGELIDLKELLVDFKEKDIKLSVTYDFDYE
jgi:hypothetical protein